MIGAAADGLGARASHLLGGHRDAHEALERALADWIGYPRALPFSTGYMAALGTLGALLGRHDLCVQDQLNHACLLDGARLAGADLRRYAHADINAASALLRAQPHKRALLVTDAVFSMDGDIAPLAPLAMLATGEGIALMVDEAHSLGVLGPEGRGACAAAGLGPGEVPIWMGTLGKALGGFGAVIAGDDLPIDTLVNNARGYIYTTALPPALARALLSAVELARNAEAERRHLQALIQQFRAGAAELGWQLLPSTTPIQPLLIGQSHDALACASAPGGGRFPRTGSAATDRSGGHRAAAHQLVSSAAGRACRALVAGAGDGTCGGFGRRLKAHCGGLFKGPNGAVHG